MNKNREMVLRVLLYIVGGVTLSVGVAFALRASWLGAGAYDVLAEVVKDILGFKEITFSYYILGVFSLTLGLLLTKNKMYVLSFIPFVTLSPVVDVALMFLPNANTWLIQILFFIIGIYLIAVGVAILILIKSPITPIDVVAMGIKQRLNFKSFGPGKIILDATLIVLVTALSLSFLGEMRLGIGTFLYCVVLGPVIDFNTNLLRSTIEGIVFKK